MAHYLPFILSFRSVQVVLLACPYQAAGEYPAVVLTGPRQAGKTTLLKHLFGQTHGYASLKPLEVRGVKRAEISNLIKVGLRVTYPALRNYCHVAQAVL